MSTFVMEIQKNTQYPILPMESKKPVKKSLSKSVTEVSNQNGMI